MKKYFVIGDPIEHSLSPKLHNYWLKENNIKAIYDKKKIKKEEIRNIIKDIKDDKIHGLNVTVPFKNSVLPFLDQLTPKAIMTQSVNTIFKEADEVIGDNTDIGGFDLSLKHFGQDVKNKKIFILGAGGVTPSIILALKSSGVSKIFLSNRTKEKAENLKKIYKDLEIIEWGKITNFDIIINTTSLGLKKEDEIKLDFSKLNSNKLFYDVIYNPAKTKFLERAEKLGNKILNGQMMFVYQAQLSFKIWHDVLPKIQNFNIISIETDEYNKINSKVKNSLKLFSNNSSKNIINVKIKSKKTISITSKNSKGDPKTYSMNINLNLEIDKNGTKKIKIFNESFEYNTKSNKFDLKKYERNVQNNLTEKIIENITLYLSTI